jgi:hypothetical protein
MISALQFQKAITNLLPLWAVLPNGPLWIEEPV